MRSGAASQLPEMIYPRKNRVVLKKPVPSSRS